MELNSKTSGAKHTNIDYLYKIHICIHIYTYYYPYTCTYVQTVEKAELDKFISSICKLMQSAHKYIFQYYNETNIFTTLLFLSASTKDLSDLLLY